MAARLVRHAAPRVEQAEWLHRRSRLPSPCFRVYWVWPGVSAMMKRRLGVEEIAIRDVYRDFLLALGPQTVREQGRG